MIVREFLTRLGFEADQSKVERFDKAVQRVATGLKVLVASATAVTGALTALTLSSARAATEINRLSQVSNTAPETLQRWAAASRAVGIEQEKLSDILKDVNDRVGDFVTTGGGPMADFFEKVAPKIGITADAFRGLSGADALQLYVSSLERANLSQAEMTFYMEAMASDSTLLLPLLRANGKEMARLGDEAEALGGVMSAETVAALVAADRAVQKVGTAFVGLKNIIAAEFAPILEELANQFVDFLILNREIIAERIHRAFEILIGVMRSLMRIMARVWSVVDTVAQAFGGWERSLKLAGIAISSIIGLNLLRWITGVNGAIRGLAALLSFKFLARWGLWGLAIGAAALALDDLVTWIEGGDSAIGALLGPFDQFVTSLGDLEQIANVVIGIALAKWAWGVAGGMFAAALGIGSVNAAMTALGRHPLFKLLTLGMIDPGTEGALTGQGGATRGIEPGSLDRMLGANEGETLGETLRGRIGSLFGWGDGPSDAVPATPGPSIIERAQPRIDDTQRYLDNMQVPPSVAPMSAPMGGEINNTSNVINMDARINISIPPGSNREQAEFIASRVRAEIEREVNRAGTALEA